MMKRSNFAFTLVELLAVMAVMLVFISLTAPLVGDVMASRATERAAMDLSGLIEYARREAVTLQTYSWVGLEAVTDDAGQTSLRASVRVSRTGAIEQISTGSGAALRTLVNMQGVEVLTRTYRWPHMNIVDPAELDRIDPPAGMTLQRFDGAPTSGFASMVNTGTETRPRYSVSPTYMHTVTFSPSGAAFLTSIPSLSDPYSEHIGIGLQYSAGRGDEALLYLNGLTGAVRIVRE